MRGLCPDTMCGRPRPIMSLVRVALVVGLASIAAPASADAHIRSGVVAVDYGASVSPLRPPLKSVVTVRIYQSDRALGLTVAGGHTVVVLGYLGEPFLRISPSGVAVNGGSPTSAGAGLLKATPGGVRATPHWQVRSNRPSFVWHDARLRGLPPGVERSQWHVPLLFDGARAQLGGEIWRIHRPALWYWIVLGVPVVAATLLLYSFRRPLLEPAAVSLGVLAAAATIAIAVGFAAHGGAAEARVVEGANEVVFALIGLAVLARGPRSARLGAAAGLGLLGVFVGLTKVSVLLQGAVLAAIPANAACVAVALALWAGVAAAIVGGALFFADIFDTGKRAPIRLVGGQRRRAGPGAPPRHRA
jgi:hypothetical protein